MDYIGCMCKNFVGKWGVHIFPWLLGGRIAAWYAVRRQAKQEQTCILTPLVDARRRAVAAGEPIKNNTPAVNSELPSWAPIDFYIIYFTPS
jgi:hypothetical protein